MLRRLTTSLAAPPCAGKHFAHVAAAPLSALLMFVHSASKGFLLGFVASSAKVARETRPLCSA